MKLNLSATTILLCTSFFGYSQSLPQKTVNGWKLNTDSYDKPMINSLKNEIQKSTYKEINSVIVIKDGKLLIEEYFNGAGRDSTHNPRSVGKTFASALVGIALDKGYLKNVNQTLSDFYDLKSYKNYDEKKSKVTVKNLLTMSSGFEGFDFEPTSIGNEENMYPESNWVNWTLNLPMANDRNPGDKWFYFTAGAVLLGDILNKNVPEGLEKFGAKYLFEPLGIKNYYWQYTPQNVPNTAGGIQLKPLDFAKFGQLYKNGGTWKGKQIISKEWISQSFQKYYHTSDTVNQYGFFWWNRTYKVNGESYEVFYCTGNGGNKIFVFQNLPLVVVITASAYGKRYAHRQVDEMMEKYIIPSVVSIHGKN